VFEGRGKVAGEMSKRRKWGLIILFGSLWGAFSTVVLRDVFGFPWILSSLTVVIGCGIFFAWINGDLDRNEGALNEFKEHEERIKIGKIYDESAKKDSK
jgi:hypothetical protein